MWDQLSGLASKFDVGEPLRRREDRTLLRGRARYLDDLEPPGLAHVAFVRSGHARATSSRSPCPPGRRGLVGVLTATDIAGRAEPLALLTVEDALLASVPHPILADGEVRYAGQPVAAVIAESRAQAEDAAELVEVEYEPRDAVVDPGAPPKGCSVATSVGDVDGAFAAAAHVVRGRYALPRLVATPMETRGVLAAYDERGDLLTVWGSFQDPHRPRAQLAGALGRAPDRIRVIVPDVGGAFGSKGVLPVEGVVVALAAIELGRPVKWAEDRMENFVAAYQGRGVQADVELALDAVGRMLAVRADILADLGAFLLPSTAIPPHTTAMLMTGCYEIPAAAVTVIGARTDKVPTGPYRGAGRPEAAYLLELTVDAAARQLGLDPAELRRRNLIRSFPHRNALGWTYDSGDYARCLELALELVAPSGVRAQRVVGTGVAMYVERAGGMWESACVTVAPSGHVVASSGSSPHGQGHETTSRRSSRTGWASIPETSSFGSATPPRFRPASGRSRAGRWRWAARRSYRRWSRLWRGRGREPRSFRGLGRFAVAWVGVGVGCAPTAGARRWPRSPLPPAVSRLTPGSNRASFSVRCVRRGRRDRARHRAVACATARCGRRRGRILNPLLAEGQVLGGVVQGLGAVLVEEAVFDEPGQPRSATFADYSLLTAVDASDRGPLRRVALSVESTGSQGDRGGRRDRHPGGGRERGRRRAWPAGAGPAAHAREAVAGAARARVKPAPFEYAAPRSVDEALALLGEDAVPLAGGQSLVPLLNLRLARPALVVDLNGIEALAGVGCDEASGTLRIGALTRQSALERSPMVAARWPLLRQAVRFAGHPQTRSRGTVGGSVAHADPAAELPVALLALDAVFHVWSVSAAGRTVPARDFFVGPLTTALEPGELLVEVEVPALPAGARTAFVEHARTHGDFATAGAAVVLGPGGVGAIAILGVEGRPVRAPDAEHASRSGASFREAAELAAAPAGDDYQRALVAELVVRALTEAAGS